MIFKKKPRFLLHFIALMVLTLNLSFIPVNAYSLTEEKSPFLIGAGIYDITGPAGEVVMMGYAQTNQSTAGIHQRLWSRAFVVEERETNKRVVIVSADLCAITQGVKQQVIEKLKEKYGDLYRDENVLISATHTHSGPAGYSHYALYNVSGYGYIEENFNCIVDGIYNSIVRATSNIEPGYIEINTGTLDDVSINRSPEAYENNPNEEKARYTSNVDKEMTVLNFKNSNGDLIGIYNWFPLHGTSMGNDNKLISGDNKGYASYLYEKEMNSNYKLDKTFVAAFGQSHSGDVSPNIYGGENGYGNNDFESTEYAGEKQFLKCKELSSSSSTRLSSNIDYKHSYINFSNIQIDSKYTDGFPRQTYPAALGYSFAAGAEDGPSGVSIFHEGMTADDYPIDGSENGALVNAVQKVIGMVPYFDTIIGTKYPELWEQHYPKPILFATSQGKPYPWTPEILPVQMVKIGELNIIAVPSEITTMSGRRLMETVKATLDQGSCFNNKVVIAGLCNAYAEYIATPEEYDLQHYEGASTHFGKWTLDAYIQEFDKLATALVNHSDVAEGPTPRNLINEQMCFQTGVVLDNTPIKKNFGDVEKDVNPSYKPGEQVEVSFWAGHPKNDLKTQSTYLAVQRKVNDDWVIIANDWDFETKYNWKRIDAVGGTSLAIITWDIPNNTEPGEYRIVHYGNYKSGWNKKIYPYTGISSNFVIN